MLKYTVQIQWLLEGDPSIRYQTLRDLCDVNHSAIKKEQDLILTQGWGKRLMDKQQPDSLWGNGYYSPKWISTFYTLLLLKRFGTRKNNKIEKACSIILDKAFYKDGGLNFWKSWKHGETCVTGMFLSMMCHFGIEDERVHRMVEFLVEEQMPDKGWNCDKPKGAVHSSFHTTISVLEGLWEYEKKYPESKLINTIQNKQHEGIEFLLKHQLYKSSKTSNIFNSRMVKLTFPPRWYYDIMRCLDYFQEKRMKKDKRMNDAMALLIEKQMENGLWKLENKYGGKVHFDMERVGKESRWNTLRALRILNWWNT